MLLLGVSNPGRIAPLGGGKALRKAKGKWPRRWGPRWLFLLSSLVLSFSCFVCRYTVNFLSFFLLLDNGLRLASSHIPPPLPRMVFLGARSGYLRCLYINSPCLFCGCR